MGILDSDSDDDASTSSEEVETSKPKTDVTKYMNKKTPRVSTFEAFKGDSNTDDNETAAKMMEVLKLREALGMDKDVAFMKEQEEKDKEKKRIAAMSPEERMAYDREQSGDMMAKIRAKQEALKKDLHAEADADAKAAAEESEEEEDLQTRLKKQAKKKKKEKKAAEKDKKKKKKKKEEE